MNVSQVISEYLGAAGIHCVYGYPGDPNIEFMDALRAGGIGFALARMWTSHGFPDDVDE